MIRILLLSCVCSLQFALAAQNNLEFRSVTPYDDILNDVWGYTDTAGNEYALVGTTTGLSILDVSAPDTPEVLHFIPGDTSIWRDIKTWNRHAYVTNEKGGGLLIVDLNFLPDSITTFTWTGDSLDYKTAHNLYIDSGFAYLFGSNILGRGAVFLDLTIPDSPSFAGAYEDFYVHDGMVRKDTMYTSEIFEGSFAIIDVRDKTNPVTLGRQVTPGAFTHNCWISDDGNFLFTTDERQNEKVAAFDISDLSNISQLGTYQSSPGDSVIPHNTHVLGNYLITSYYRDGVTIVDATNPQNLVEVGAFDTSPLTSAPGFEGCWGAYPYLPSGNILATDREEGLFVLTPTYTRACYLEGTVNDSATGGPLSDIRVDIIGTDQIARTNITGNYYLGVADSGLYNVRFYHQNCQTIIYPNISLKNAQTTNLNTTLECAFPQPTGLANSDRSNIQLIATPSIFSTNTVIRYKLFENHNQHVKIAIYDANGKAVHQFDFQTPQGQIRLNDQLNKGIYFVQLNTPAYRQSIRIVKI